MRRIGLALVALVGLACVFFFAFLPAMVERSQNKVLQLPTPDLSSEATRLHQSLFVADLHADPLLWNRDLLQRSSHGHVDVPRLREGGVALQVFGVVTQVPGGQNYDSNELRTDLITPLAIAQLWPVASWSSPKERALHQARKLRDLATRASGRFIVVDGPQPLQQLLERRKSDRGITAGLLAIEGLQAIEGDLGNLDALHQAGFRMMGLTHFFDNPLGGSAHGVSKSGLSDFGRQAVRRMEERGIVVDLAHASPAMIEDVLGMATRPVVVSHTGVKGTCDHIRNLPDEHLRRVAATDGVIGIGYWDAAVCDVSVAGIVRAIRYTVGIAGIEHVGLGSDFDGATTTPFDTSGLARLTDGLLAEGFSEADVAKIMGENVLRLLRQTLRP
jgi:membrane dipeptidase